MEQLKDHQIDFFKMDSYGENPYIASAMAQVRPADATLTKPRYGRSDSTRPDNCAYCRFRPLAPPGTPEDQKYKYGTGDGNHSPHGCMPCKKFLAEGGDVSQFPDAKGHISSLLVLRERRG